MFQFFDLITRINNKRLLRLFEETVAQLKMGNAGIDCWIHLERKECECGSIDCLSASGFAIANNLLNSTWRIIEGIKHEGDLYSPLYA